MAARARRFYDARGRHGLHDDADGISGRTQRQLKTNSSARTRTQSALVSLALDASIATDFPAPQVRPTRARRSRRPSLLARRCAACPWGRPAAAARRPRMCFSINWGSAPPRTGSASAARVGSGWGDGNRLPRTGSANKNRISDSLGASSPDEVLGSPFMITSD